MIVMLQGIIIAACMGRGSLLMMMKPCCIAWVCHVSFSGGWMMGRVKRLTMWLNGDVR